MGWWTAVSCLRQVQDARQVRTRYIAAYDTESAGCLAVCRKIADVHERFEVPATFFVVGRTLDAKATVNTRMLATEY